MTKKIKDFSEEEQLDELTGKGKLPDIEKHHKAQANDLLKASRYTMDAFVRGEEKDRDLENTLCNITGASALSSKKAFRAKGLRDIIAAKDTLKKKKQEYKDIKNDDEMNFYGEEEQVKESVGSDTLHPGSQAVDDPKSKFQVIASAIGALAQVDTTSLTKFYDEMMSLIGHEADPIANGTSAKNAATIAMKEEFNNLFEGDETFTEDFKKKAFTLFEAAVETRVALNTSEIEEQLAEEYTELLEQEIETIEEGIKEYLDYAADVWMEDNKLVVENSLRTEITEDFIKGLKDLFEQHYIDIPDESVDIVEGLSEKVEFLEARMNELISENAELTDLIEQETLNNIVEDACKGLTLVEQDKLRSLAETISYESREDFASKLQTIKESQVIKGKTSALNEQLEEVNEDNKEDKKIVTSPEMKNYVDAIARSIKTS